jgi:hypothetical protein
MLRFLCCTVLFGSFVFSAMAAPRPEQAPAKAAVAPKPVANSEAEYKAARDRDEARQKEWDRKMKALTSSICTGC